MFRKLAEFDDVVDKKRPFIRHYCFLVHGFLGIDEEMSYIEEAIKRSLDVYSSNAMSKKQSEVLIYKIKTNHGKTRDGIIKGGKRVAKEVLDIILNDSICNVGQDKHCGCAIKTISFVGHSLGGLYSRYAIAEINAQVPDHFHFNIFCTTATPHIGISSHTYFPLPRALERVVAVVLGKTGKHLFRTKRKNDIVKQMCLSPHYLTPLSHFRTRIAYSNTFGSDFVVPTKTSAFLHGSTMHKVVGNVLEDRQDNDAFLLSAFTKQTYNVQRVPPEVMKNDRSSKTDEHLQMSKSLDSLGWKKVFVDVRHLSPIKHIRPPLSKRNSRKALSESISSKTLSCTQSSSLSDNLSDTSSTTKTSYDTELESEELAKLLSKGDSISLPVGHTVMIANSKTKFSARMNAGGKAVMNSLAQDFVQELLDWDQ